MFFLTCKIGLKLPNTEKEISKYSYVETKSSHSKTKNWADFIYHVQVC